MKERHDGLTTLFSLLNVEHSPVVGRNKDNKDFFPDP